MTDRPDYLIIVTHPKQGVEIFSAHGDEGEAEDMHDRLVRLLSGTGSSVHTVPIPSHDGLVKNEEQVRSTSAAPAPAESAPQSPEIQNFYNPQSRDELAEETRAMLEGASGLKARDADDPIDAGGTIS